MVVFIICVHVRPPSVEDSHLTILPVAPTSVKVLPFAPEQTVALVLTLPPTDVGLMVIVAGAEVIEGQVPLANTALYCVVCVRFVYDCTLVILAMEIQVVPPFVEDSHRETLPVDPVNVRTPVPVPQKEALLLTVPPTDPGVTVIVAAEEFAILHPAL